MSSGCRQVQSSIIRMNRRMNNRCSSLSTSLFSQGRRSLATYFDGGDGMQIRMPNQKRTLTMHQIKRSMNGISSYNTSGIGNNISLSLSSSRYFTSSTSPEDEKVSNSSSKEAQLFLDFKEKLTKYAKKGNLNKMQDIIDQMNNADNLDIINVLSSSRSGSGGSGSVGGKVKHKVTRLTLDAATLSAVFDAYEHAQSEVLDGLQLDTDGIITANFDDNDSDTERDTITKTDAASITDMENMEKIQKQNKDILNHAWQITNDVDDLLQEYTELHRVLSQDGPDGNPCQLRTEHFELVISTWERLQRASLDASIYANENVTTTLDAKEGTKSIIQPQKGMPQRATHHLEVMERLALLHGESRMVIGVGRVRGGGQSYPIAPSVETYNTILSMLGRSKEHLRHHRADSIVRKILCAGSKKERDSTRSNTSTGAGTVISTILGVVPNVETYRLMIRAWGSVGGDSVLDLVSDSNSADDSHSYHSKKVIGKAAFNAQNYLIQMQRLMENDMQNTNYRAFAAGEVEEDNDDDAVDGRNDEDDDIEIIEWSDFEPTLDDYLVVFRAWSKAGQAMMAGKRAHDLLRKMEALTRIGMTQVKPNVDCYKYTLQAISESAPKNVNEFAAENILKRMEENGLVPDSDCFTYAIKAWCKTVKSNSISQKVMQEKATKAHELLEQMEEMYYRSGSVEVRPTTVDYNNVIGAWSSIPSSKYSVEKADGLLTKMELKYKDGDMLMMPTDSSYFHVLRAWDSSPKDAEVMLDGAMDTFARMKAQYEDGNDACKPNTHCYNVLLSVCRRKNLQNANENDRRKALKCVVNTVKAMRSSPHTKPTSMTYHMLLEAFNVLLKRGEKEHERTIESIFKRCCKEGLVDQKVLNTFSRIAPYDIFKRVVISGASAHANERVMSLLSDSGAREISTSATDTFYVPSSWTSKTEIRSPLKIDGTFDHSYTYRAVTKHKMRRLRRKDNQSLLVGGRS
mmetsp:Transcript_25041/g.38273  ORF Transcript_25041/g.38273 Transcript_25041/m.38273 type:complete len:970 (+) Transcript_25041:254-3163(+)|eukprot:CAMPEP_0194095554 /NCGR_PEP_ID=MMETSP0149-20130528/56886_1 /TAXON_ID=122233 /ORGANISM="Chaetoceros debilis, Strain MM31A-1" /LENGTH=969 /DNA_ID=CAMNT_0038781499 /DNA_START=174 /DNA_END=3083 /DNA_ORIENTATION=-